MNKSDKLDELRFEVGMVAEQVNTYEEFYQGIIRTMAKLLPAQFGVAIYGCLDGYFTFLSGWGSVSEQINIKFGESMFSICSIRGKVIIHKNEKSNYCGYAPIYDGHHLVGIFYVECTDQSYIVTEEDCIFLMELARYIETKRKVYLSSPIDKIDN